MATTSSPVANSFAIAKQRDTVAAAAAVSNIRNGPTNFKGAYVSNPSAQIVYLKLYNHLAPTIGGTAPELIFPIAATSQCRIEGLVKDANGVIQKGYPFTTAMSYACVQEPGTAGTTAPSSSVVVDMDLED